jgi:isoleucyl-tRNA synthetase
VRAHQDQILEELNVRALELAAADAELVSYRLKPNLPKVGKKHGKLIPRIREALTAADGKAIATAAAAGRAFELTVGDETLTLEAEDVLVETSSAEGYACAEESGFLVGLDTRLDDDLRREGLARELVRTAQDARKQAGLEVSDRITLRIEGTPGVEAALARHREMIMDETLATEWGEAGFTGDFRSEHSLEGERWTILLARRPPR